MMVVLGYFLIAAVAVISASAIIGFFLTNLLMWSLQKLVRYTRVRRGKISVFSTLHHLLRNCLRIRKHSMTTALTIMPNRAAKGCRD